MKERHATITHMDYRKDFTGDEEIAFLRKIAT